MKTRTLSTEEIDMECWRNFRRLNPLAQTQRWHEGSELVGYWPEGDSFVFKVDRQWLAISRGFIEKIAKGEVEFDD